MPSKSKFSRRTAAIRLGALAAGIALSVLAFHLLKGGAAERLVVRGDAVMGSEPARAALRYRLSYRLSPEPETRLKLAESLIRSGQLEEGAQLAEAIYTENPSAASAYWLVFARLEAGEEGSTACATLQQHPGIEELEYACQILGNDTADASLPARILARNGLYRTTVRFLMKQLTLSLDDGLLLGYAAEKGGVASKEVKNRLLETAAKYPDDSRLRELADNL